MRLLRCWRMYRRARRLGCSLFEVILIARSACRIDRIN